MLSFPVRRRLALAVLIAFVVGLLTILVVGRPAFGEARLPSGFSQSQVAGGLSGPTAMEFAPDGRLFVAEKEGTLRVIEDGQLQEEPFVKISDQVDARGERGLLGAAFDPAFEAGSPYVYVYYTRKASGGTPAHNRVVRFTADGNRAVNGSEELLFRLNNLGDSQSHNGGAIHFGEDGKLYVAVGDNRKDRQAQSLGSLFGKMLRINADGSIPEDNPYLGASGKNKAIWARGLRNPFSFDVQPGTGEIYINDVGEKRFEEINRGRARANYGWPRYEGRDRARRFENPLFAYKHDDLPNTPSGKSGCAITGGAFYNPQTLQFPAEYEGDYFFADFCNGWIRRLDAGGEGGGGFATGANFPVDLKVGEDGVLYYLERGSGSVKAIRYTG